MLVLIHILVFLRLLATANISGEEEPEQDQEPDQYSEDQKSALDAIKDSINSLMLQDPPTSIGYARKQNLDKFCECVDELSSYLIYDPHKKKSALCAQIKYLRVLHGECLKSHFEESVVKMVNKVGEEIFALNTTINALFIRLCGYVEFEEEGFEDSQREHMDFVHDSLQSRQQILIDVFNELAGREAEIFLGSAACETGIVDRSCDTDNPSCETGTVGSVTDTDSANPSCEASSVNPVTDTDSANPSCDTGTVNPVTDTDSTNSSSETSSANPSCETYSINSSSEIQQESGGILKPPVNAKKRSKSVSLHPLVEVNMDDIVFTVPLNPINNTEEVDDHDSLETTPSDDSSDEGSCEDVGEQNTDMTSVNEYRLYGCDFGELSDYKKACGELNSEKMALTYESPSYEVEEQDSYMTYVGEYWPYNLNSDELPDRYEGLGDLNLTERHEGLDVLDLDEKHEGLDDLNFAERHEGLDVLDLDEKHEGLDDLNFAERHEELGNPGLTDRDEGLGDLGLAEKLDSEKADQYQQSMHNFTDTESYLETLRIGSEIQSPFGHQGFNMSFSNENKTPSVNGPGEEESFDFMYHGPVRTDLGQEKSFSDYTVAGSEMHQYSSTGLTDFEDMEQYQLKDDDIFFGKGEEEEERSEKS